MTTLSVFTPRDLLDLYLLFDRALNVRAARTEADTVAAIVALAVAEVPGVEQASISDRRGHRFRYQRWHPVRAGGGPGRGRDAG